MSYKVGTILLSHQPPTSLKRMLEYWRALDPEQDFLIAYGGIDSSALSIESCKVVKVDDPELKTRDHPRERQSYLGVFRSAVEWIQQHELTHIHVAEFDEIPLVKNLNSLLVATLEREGCDVLGHRLRQVDQTNHPHCLSHMADPRFMGYWKSMSRRDDKNVILSMLGCGSFWTKEAFLSIASLQPPLRIYLELLLPTAAHHLGFRVRNIPTDDAFMAPEVMKDESEIEKYKSLGAWRMHPVKNMWTKEL
jgi:hypothetical protein